MGPIESERSKANVMRLTTDIEENGVRLKLTVVDTPGFGDFVNNDDSCVNSLFLLSKPQS